MRTKWVRLAAHNPDGENMAAKKFVTATAVALALIGGLTACTPEPPATTTVEAIQESEEPSPEPTETEEPKADPGSRELPLKPGQARKVSEESAFTVGAGKAEVKDGYVQAEFTIGIDWKSMEAQGASGLADYQPGDPAYPFISMQISFMDKGGKTYTEYPRNFDTNLDYALALPEVFPPAKSQSGYVAVEVPKDKVDGGLWVVSNIANDRVFIAQK
jgi:hypothetical protein